MKNRKYFSVIAAYFGVLVASVASLIMMYVVGAPEIVFILQIVGILLNLAQITLYVVHAAKSGRGEPATGIGRVILALNIAWVALTAANFILASLGAYLRWDLAGVWACQLLTVLFVYKMWSRIEYKVALKNYACTDRDKLKTGGSRYFAFVIIVIVIQLISVAFPIAIMSTQFRNEGLQYRNLMYESSEDGTEYYVKGVYWGASKKVFIPAEFNGRKVTKILDGAIDSETVWNKLITSSKEIDTVIFEDTEEHPSNIREIGDRAIVGDNITEITLPASVESIGQEAIVSQNLKKVELFAQNGNVYFGTSIVTPVLETLSISATSDANIVFEDTFQKDGLSVTIVNDNEDKTDTDKVQEKYNYIRENYPEIREGLSVENVEKKVILNFESRMEDVFVPSKILDLVSGVAELRTSMLDELWTSTNRFINDRTFFIKDLIFTEPSTGLRYIFRGWENELGKLVVFDSDTYSALFNKDTTLYARWAKVCNVTYDWGNYFVPTETTALEREFIVGEEVNNFDLPTFARYNREGYRDLKWYCFDEADTEHYSLSANYLSTASFRDTVVLTPVWDLDFLSVGVLLEYTEGNTNEKETLNSTSKNFEYDKTHELSAIYTIRHQLNKTNRYTVNWSFTPAEEAASFGAVATNGSFELQYDVAGKGHCAMSNVHNLSTAFTCEYLDETDELCFIFSTKNVLESGTYSVSVLATSANSEQVETVSAGAKDVTVIIDPKRLSDAEYQDVARRYQIAFPSESFVFDRAPKSIFPSKNADAPISFGNIQGNGESEVSPKDTVYDVSAEITFLKEDGTSDPNYLTYTIRSFYTISKIKVKVRWRIDGMGEDTAPYSIVYDGAEHTMVASVISATEIEDDLVLTGDVRETDSGTYIVTLAPLSEDKSYEFDLTEEEMSCTWTIAPRPVNLVWSATRTVYNGLEQTVTATVGNLCTNRQDEECTVTAYQDNVKLGAGVYTPKVLSISNEKNYTLTDAVNSTWNWTIDKKAVTVLWSFGNYNESDGFHTTYNALDQKDGIRAVATNPCTNAQGVEDAISFLYTGAVRGEEEKDIALDSVVFRNAGNYTLSIVGIQGEAANNYTIDYLAVDVKTDRSKSCNWTIDKKALEKKWFADYSSDFASGIVYDGAKYTFDLVVEGFQGTDVQDITAANFVVAKSDVDLTLTGRYADGNDTKYILSLTVIRACRYKMDVSAELANYTLPETTGTSVDYFTVSPKALSFNWYTNQACTEVYSSLIYRGTDHEIFAKPVEELCWNEALNARDTLTVTRGGVFKVANAGTYTATVAALDNRDYTVADGYTDKEWTITPKTLTITSNTDVDTVYGGDVKTAYLTLSGFVNGEAAAMPTVTPADALAITCTEGGILVGAADDDAYVITLKAVNAKAYTLTLSDVKTAYNGLDMKNYTLAAEKSVTLTIGKLTAELTWTAAEGANYTYDGTVRVVSASVTNAVENAWKDPKQDAPVLSYVGGNDSTSKRNVGVYVTTVSAIDDENYALPSEASAKVRNWSIQRPAALTHSWNGLNATYNKTSKVATLTISGLMASDCAATWDNEDNVTVAVSPSLPYTFTPNPTDHEVSFSFSNVNAATFDITVTVKDRNYSETDLVFDGTFTIAKKVLTFNWSTSYDLEFDNKGHTDAYIATANNLEIGDSITGFTYSNTDDCKYVGEHSTKIETIVGGTGSANYALPASDDAKTYHWSITPRILSGVQFKQNSEVVNSATFTYGDASAVVSLSWIRAKGTLSFAGKGVTVTPAAGTIDTPGGASTASVDFSGVAAGTYTITVPAFANENNHTLEAECKFTVTITPSQLRVNAPDGLTYNGAAQTYGITVTGLAAGDAAGDIYAITGNTATNAGNYTAYVRLNQAKSANYLLEANENNNLSNTERSVSWSIAKKALSVAWTGASSAYTYNGTPQTYAITVTGYQDGEGDGKGAAYTIDGDGNEQTNVGNYTITLNAIGNYTFESGATVLEKTWSIEKRVLSGFTWSNAVGFVYDRTEKTVTATAGNAVGAVTFTYSTNAVSTNGATSAGDYKTVVTGIVGEANNNNYALPVDEVAKNWSIAKAELTIDWTDYTAETTYTYNGVVREYRVTVNGVIYGDAHGNVYAVNGNFRKDAGETSVTVSIKDATNYKFANGVTTQRTWSIAKRQLGVTWTDSATEYTYNGLAQTYRVDVSGVQIGDENVYTVTDNQFTDVGTRTATVTVNQAHTKNYILAGGATAVTSDSWTIAPKVINITNADLDKTSAVYSRNEITFTLSIAPAGEPATAQVYARDLTSIRTSCSLTKSENITADFAYQNNTLKILLKVTNAGDYTVTLNGLNGNYTIGNNKQVSFAVEKKTITADLITLKANSFEYSGAVVTPVVLIDDQELMQSHISRTGTTSATNANTSTPNYSMTVNGLTDDNYKLGNEVTKTLTWTITPKTLGGVTASYKLGTQTVTRFTYGDQNAIVTLTWEGAVGALTFADRVSTTGGVLNTSNAGTATINFSGVSAGTYTITVAAFSNVNDHSLASERIFTVVVDPKILTITPPSTALTYNGTEQTYGVSVSGFVLGQKLSDVCTVSGDTKKTAAGNYTWNLAVDKSTDYVVDNEGHTTKALSWSIAKASLAVSWPDEVAETKYFYNGNTQTYRINVEHYAAGEGAGVSYTLTENAKKNAGSYKATVTITDNYKFEGYEDSVRYLEKSWSIAKSDLSVNWTEQTFTYDGTEKTYVVVVNGCAQGEGAGVSYSVSGNEQTNAGSYTVTVTLEDGNNYTLSGETSKGWSIGKRPLAVTWTNANKTYTYDGTVQNYNISVSGYLDGHGLGDSYSVSDNAKKDTGTYEAKVDIKDSNYKFANQNDEVTQITRNWTIQKKELRLVFTDEYQYTGSPITLVYSVTDTQNAPYDIAAIENADYPSKTNVSSNYTATFTLDKNHCFENAATSKTVNWSITKRQLRLSFTTFDDNRVPYDGATHKSTVTIINKETGLEGYSNKCTVTLKNAVGDVVDDPKDAGSYTLSVTLNDPDNFRIVSASSSYTWSILPKELTLTCAENQSFTYDKSAHRVNYTIKEGNTTLNATQINSLLDVKNETATNGGSYTATFTCKSGNYVFKKGNSTYSSLSVKWDIEARLLTSEGQPNLTAQIMDTTAPEPEWVDYSEMETYPYRGEDAYLFRFLIQYKNASNQTVTEDLPVIRYMNSDENPYAFGSTIEISWAIDPNYTSNYTGGDRFSISIENFTLDVKARVQPDATVREYTVAELKAAVVGSDTFLESELTYEYYDTNSQKVAEANLQVGTVYKVKVSTFNTNIVISNSTNVSFRLKGNA